MTEDMIEQLARAIHAVYTHSTGSSGATTQSGLAAIAWDDLDETDKESNRAQAAAIGEKLSYLGLYVVPIGTPGAHELVIADDDVEELARLEHDRWWAHKIETGWKPAPDGRRDVEQQLHELLKPYDQLTEGQKQLDRDPVLAIPALLRLVGLAVRGVD